MGRGEQGEGRRGIRSRSGGKSLMLEKFLSPSLDSEIWAHSVSNTCVYTAQSEMVIQVAPAGKRVVGWLVGAGVSGVCSEARVGYAWGGRLWRAEVMPLISKLMLYLFKPF